MATENNVGWFGPADGTLGRYKNAVEASAEAEYWAKQGIQAADAVTRGMADIASDTQQIVAAKDEILGLNLNMNQLVSLVNDAQNSATAAGTQATAARGSATDAATSANTAAQTATQVAASAQAAAASATDAATSAGQAATSLGDAQKAETAAELAQARAEAAQTASQTAQATATTQAQTAKQEADRAKAEADKISAQNQLTNAITGVGAAPGYKVDFKTMPSVNGVDITSALSSGGFLTNSTTVVAATDDMDAASLAGKVFLVDKPTITAGVASNKAPVAMEYSQAVAIDMYVTWTPAGGSEGKSRVQQIFDRNSIWTRGYHQDTGTWTPWKRTQSQFYVEVDGMDLDTIDDSGMYTFATAIGGPTFDASSTSSIYFMIVASNNDNSKAMQTVYSPNSNTAFTRYRVSGTTWGAWENTTANIDVVIAPAGFDFDADHNASWYEVDLSTAVHAPAGSTTGKGIVRIVFLSDGTTRQDLYKADGSHLFRTKNTTWGAWNSSVSLSSGNLTGVANATFSGNISAVNITGSANVVGTSVTAKIGTAEGVLNSTGNLTGSSWGTVGLKQFLADTYVPKTTTINGRALSGNISLTAADLGITGSTYVTVAGTQTITGQKTFVGDSNPTRFRPTGDGEPSFISFTNSAASTEIARFGRFTNLTGDTTYRTIGMSHIAQTTDMRLTYDGKVELNGKAGSLISLDASGNTVITSTAMNVTATSGANFNNAVNIIADGGGALVLRKKTDTNPIGIGFQSSNKAELAHLNKNPNGDFVLTNHAGGGVGDNYINLSNDGSALISSSSGSKVHVDHAGQIGFFPSGTEVTVSHGKFLTLADGQDALSVRKKTDTANIGVSFQYSNGSEAARLNKNANGDFVLLNHAGGGIGDNYVNISNDGGVYLAPTAGRDVTSNSRIVIDGHTGTDGVVVKASGNVGMTLMDAAGTERSIWYWNPTAQAVGLNGNGNNSIVFDANGHIGITASPGIDAHSYGFTLLAPAQSGAPNFYGPALESKFTDQGGYRCYFREMLNPNQWHAALIGSRDGSGGGDEYALAGNGQIYRTHDGAAVHWDASDAKLKHDIVDAPVDALARVEKMQPKDFTWNRDGREDRGYIAQDLKEIDERYVFESAGFGTLNVSSNAIVADLIGAVKELSARVKELEAKAK